MSGSPFDADAYARQAAAILGIPLSDAQRPGVVANLTRTAEQARSLMDFELPDERQPAPVYRP